MKTNLPSRSFFLAFALAALFIGIAPAQDKVGILLFEQKNAPGLAERVRDTLTQSFQQAGYQVINEAEIDAAARAIPGGAKLDPGGAQKIGQKTGADWIVTGRVIGGPVTFVVAKVINTRNADVTGDARQVRDPSEMEQALRELGSKLVRNIAG